MTPDREMGGKIAVVGTLPRGQPIELEIIAPDRDRLSRPEFRDALKAPLRLADNPEQRDAEAKMREGGTPGRARQPFCTRERGRERHLEQTRALHDFGQGTGHHV